MRLIHGIPAFLIALSLAASVCRAEPMTREEFLEAAKGSYVTEMGSFGTTTGDEKEFGPYICRNWRTILEEFDRLVLLKSDGMHGLHYVTIALACEELPPFEYLDFLDQMLGVLEQKKARNESIGYADLIFYGRGRKDSFLAVNWEHPRVQKILQRAILILSDIDTDAAASLQREARGELADNYMGDRSDAAPLPETLPGIKLKRPWGSLLKKYELLTGKKVPHDPKYDPRPSRREGNPGESPESEDPSGSSSGWPWVAFAIALFATAISIWKFRGRFIRSSASIR